MNPDVKFTAAVIITSDRASQGVYADKTGGPLKQLLEAQGYDVREVTVIPDDLARIVAELKRLVAAPIDFIVTKIGRAHV